MSKGVEGNSGGDRYFEAGGTLSPFAQSYLARQADEDLLTTLLMGHYCYILDSRQKGKSSLIARMCTHLREHGVRTVRLDLQRIGSNLTPLEWYGGLAYGITRDIEVNRPDLNAEDMGPMATWHRWIEEVVVPSTQKPIVIFVDEIDFVRSLPFSADEFFAGIRDLYNERGKNPDLGRLSFCLVGSALPNAIIANSEITPFNIGKQIFLRDFNRSELEPYAGYVKPDILDRIYYWTQGHPYLTQKLCLVSLERNCSSRENLDQIVTELFLTDSARRTEANLSDLDRRVLATGSDDSEKASILTLYRQILRGAKFPSDESNTLTAKLVLAGLISSEGKVLASRNKIYAKVFGLEWILKNMPDAELRRQKRAFRQGLVRAGVMFGSATIVFAALAGYAAMLYRDRELAQVTAHTQFMRAERLLYGRTMSLVNLEAGRGHYGQVSELVDSVEKSPYRGWEWTFWHQFVNRQRQSYHVPSAARYIVRGTDGAIVVGGEDGVYKQSGSRFTKLVDSGAVPHPLDPVGRYWLLNPPDIFDTWTRTTLRTGFRQTVRGYFLNQFVVFDGKWWQSFKFSNGNLTKGHRYSSDETARLVSFSADNRSFCYIDAGANCTIFRDGKRVVRFHDPSFSVPTAARFTEDLGSIYYCGDSWSIWRFDAKRGRIIKSYPVHRAANTSLALLDHDKKMLSTSFDGTAKLTSLPDGANLLTLFGHLVAVTTAWMDPSGKEVITGSSDGELRVWDVPQIANQWDIHDHHGKVGRVILNKDATRLLTVAEDGTARLYNSIERRLIAQINIGRCDPPQYAEITNDQSRFVVGGTSGRVWCLNAATGKIEWCAKIGSEVIRSIATSADGRNAFVGDSAGLVARISMDNGSMVVKRKYSSKTPLPRIFRLRQQGQLLAFGLGYQAVIANSQTLADLKIFPLVKDRSTVRSVVPTKDLSHFLCCYTTGVILVDRTGKEVQTFGGSTGRVFYAILSPNESRVLTIGQDGMVRIYDRSSGKQLYALRHNSWVSEARYSPDGSRILTCSDDGTMRLWLAETGEEVARFELGNATIFDAVFSGDGSTIANGSADGTVRVYFSRMPSAK